MMVVRAGFFHLTLFSVCFLLSYTDESEKKSQVMSEADALLGLKASFNNSADSLATWSNTSIPCDGKVPWIGIICVNGVVRGLRLRRMNLSGKIDIDALADLPYLRTVSFTDNFFTGNIPNFKKLRHLKAIYISNNHFEGFIPDKFFDGMTHLKKFWIPGNAFSGTIPSSINKMDAIMELRLENNRFSGKIPNVGEKLLRLKSFNVSHNQLVGYIPERFVHFGLSAFAGNQGLCGKPMQFSHYCSHSHDHLLHSHEDMNLIEEEEHDEHFGSIKVGVLAFLLTVLFAMLFLLLIRKNDNPSDKVNDGFTYIGRNHMTPRRNMYRAESASVHSTMSENEQSAIATRMTSFGKGALVVLNEEKGRFALSDLMKADAQSLGNGTFSSSFKAVIPNTGISVVVKCIKEMNRLDSLDFRTEMKKLAGIVGHPNVHAPIAFHYRDDEKLVVYEYVEKGSLLYNLHGDNRRTNRAALDWPTRLRIVKGITHGLQHLHEKFPESKVPHGNFKSGNILLTQNFTPLIVDYGYIPFFSPFRVKTSFLAYKTPEYIKNNVVSPKSDVYCLGIVVLELLTGNFPSQYINSGKGGIDVVHWTRNALNDKKEDEILDHRLVENLGSVEMKGIYRLLRLAVKLVRRDPDKRPSLTEVVKRIDAISDDVGASSRRRK
ncbi:hypothetical protein ZOSMA_116G00080 [Zostera marina]|uniref:Protein kinase domain-containing protein n=1 Tax=Zostera marina TaxID=29655 RepID=A0A0K9Q200_ZOSMR|nr:hypothetical protein ZOSMA_116G00080 [Zostera marina]